MHGTFHTSNTFVIRSMKTYDIEVFQKIEDAKKALCNTSILSKEVLNNVYDTFCVGMENEFKQKVDHKTVRYNVSKTSKTHHKPKHYWTEELSQKWQRVKETKRKWKKQGNRCQELHREMVSAQLDFDRMLQCTKRQYWKKQQDDLLDLQLQNSRDF